MNSIIKYLIISTILLLAPASFGEFKKIDKSVGELLKEGFDIIQIDTIHSGIFIYHLRSYETIAICQVDDFKTRCRIDKSGE